LQRLTQIKPEEIGSSTQKVVRVQFADGREYLLDLAPWIARGGVRAKLADQRLFRAVMVNDEGAPEWPGEIDLSPGTLRAWCEAGRVMTKEDTDAWIARHSKAAQSVA
jgi:uncharacterized protein DUF2442